MSWELCVLRTVCLENFVSWELYVLRTVCLENFMSWELCVLRTVCLENFVSWELYVLRTVCLRTVCLENCVSWELCVLRTVCLACVKLLWDTKKYSYLCRGRTGGWGRSVVCLSVPKFQQHCQSLMLHLMERNQGPQRRRTNLGLIVYGNGNSRKKHLHFSVLGCGVAYLLRCCHQRINQCERLYNKNWQERVYKLCGMGYNL